MGGSPLRGRCDNCAVPTIVTPKRWFSLLAQITRAPAVEVVHFSDLLLARAERSRFTEMLSHAQEAINDVGWETAKSILELAIDAKSRWDSRSPAQRKAFLDELLSNPMI